MICGVKSTDFEERLFILCMSIHHGRGFKRKLVNNFTSIYTYFFVYFLVGLYKVSISKFAGTSFNIHE